jgi:hypothetical protein
MLHVFIPFMTHATRGSAHKTYRRLLHCWCPNLLLLLLLWPPPPFLACYPVLACCHAARQAGLLDADRQRHAEHQATLHLVGLLLRRGHS